MEMIEYTTNLGELLNDFEDRYDLCGGLPFLCKIILKVMALSESNHEVDVIEVFKHHFPWLMTEDSSLNVFEGFLPPEFCADEFCGNLGVEELRRKVLNTLINAHGADYQLTFTVTEK